MVGRAEAMREPSRAWCASAEEIEMEWGKGGGTGGSAPLLQQVQRRCKFERGAQRRFFLDAWSLSRDVFTSRRQASGRVPRVVSRIHEFHIKTESVVSSSYKSPVLAREISSCNLV